MIEITKYYEVIAKCGHVGKKYYVPIKFAVVAKSGKDAAKIARQIPRVKHHHKDAILKVTKIDYETFLELKEINSKDPYLKCSSKQEQRKIVNLNERLEIDSYNEKEEYDKQDRFERVIYKIKKNKILEKFSWEDSGYDYAY